MSTFFKIQNRFVSYLSNGVVYHLLSFSVAWEGDLLANTSTAQYPPLWHAHTSFPTKRVSLLSLSGFYCTRSRSTETPKWYNTNLPLHVRGGAGTSALDPNQCPDLAVSSNPCQLLPYETPFPRPPHYCGCDFMCSVPSGITPVFSAVSLSSA